MKNKNTHPFPLFGTYEQVKGLTSIDPYPSEIPFIRKKILELSEKIKVAEHEYALAIEFINLYGRKSKATFNNFRSETENFLLYSWVIKETPIKSMGFSEINNYLDFYMNPLTTWVNTQQKRHFIPPSSVESSSIFSEGDLEPNQNWRPFRVKVEDFNPSAIKTKRLVSQSSLKSLFSIISLFYVFLTLKKYVNGDPIPAVKMFSPYIIKSSEPPFIRTFSFNDWEMIREILVIKADENIEYERHLFAIITMKSLYLRISEISSRDNWEPVMGNIKEIKENGIVTGEYYMTVFGKGNKLRRVSIPNEYLYYLKRYRLSRGLTEMPEDNESNPLIHKKNKGNNNISVRHAARIINEGFELVINHLKSNKVPYDLKDFIAASSHWLRHTGASHDVMSRPIKHISEDLGHKDLATTDRYYIQSSESERMKSGSKRKV